MIIELGFLKIFVSWELFLENTFINYMLGFRSPRFKPNAYVLPKNREHALDMLRGLKRFPDFTKVDDVIGIANLYFKNGKPYNKLNQMKIPLEDTRIIRNSIAHISKNSKIEFEKIIRREFGHLPKNITPGKFLSTIKPNTNSTFLEFYTKTFELGAKIVVP